MKNGNEYNTPRKRAYKLGLDARSFWAIGDPVTNPYTKAGLRAAWIQGFKAADKAAPATAQEVK